jgi:hypothetical protein
MDYSEMVAEVERFVGKAVWVGVFATDGGERFPVLTSAGRFQKGGLGDPVIAGAASSVGTPENTTFFLDEPRVHLNLWANLVVGAEWVEVAEAQRLRLSLRDGTGIDLAEYPKDEAELLGLT